MQMALESLLMLSLGPEMHDPALCSRDKLTVERK